MFRTACIPPESDDMGEDRFGKSYIVKTSEIYELVLVRSLENVHRIFRHHLSLPSNNRSITMEMMERIKQSISSKEKKKIRQALISFFKSILEYIDSIHSTNNVKEQASVLVFLVDALEVYIYILVFQLLLVCLKSHIQYHSICRIIFHFLLHYHE